MRYERRFPCSSPNDPGRAWLHKNPNPGFAASPAANADEDIMGPLGWLLAIIFFISFMTFVTFFGRLPALRYVFHNLSSLTWHRHCLNHIFSRNTPISGLHRLIWVYLPNCVLSLDLRLTSGKVTGSMTRLANHLMYDRHPTIVVSCTGAPYLAKGPD